MSDLKFVYWSEEDAPEQYVRKVAFKDKHNCECSIQQFMCCYSNNLCIRDSKVNAEIIDTDISLRRIEDVKLGHECMKQLRDDGLCIYGGDGFAEELGKEIRIDNPKNIPIGHGVSIKAIKEQLDKSVVKINHSDIEEMINRGITCIDCD